VPDYEAPYDRPAAADAYDARVRGRHRLSGRLELRMVRRGLRDATGESVLDCPCGTGRLDALLRERFTDVTGVDGAQAMLDVYLRGDPRRKGQVADVFDLPFADDAFDWAVCHRLFHHLKDDDERERLLRSLARVARHGFSLYCWLAVPFSRRGRTPGRGRQTIRAAQLEALAARAGLRVDRIHYAAWPFSPKAMAVCRPA